MRPFSIHGNSNFTFENGVSSGNGTKKNTYIIKNLDIKAKKGEDQNSYGIRIENTDSHFVIRDCYVHQYKYLYYHIAFLFTWVKEWGVHFYNVSNGMIDNCYITGTGHAIRLNNSKNNIISNCYYDNNGCGIGVFDNSVNNIIKNCHSKNFVCGVCIYYNSSNNIIDNCSAVLSFTPVHTPFNFLRLRGFGSGWVGFYIFEKSSNNKILNCKSYSFNQNLKNRFIKRIYRETIEGFNICRESNNNTVKNCLSFNLPVGIRVDNLTLIKNYYGIHNIESPKNIFQNTKYIDNKIDNFIE